MLIVSACDARMIDLARIWEKRVSGLGYDYLLYDIDDLGYGPKLEMETAAFRALDAARPGVFPDCLHKPVLIKTVCAAYPGELVVYLDVDAFPVARFDEVDDGTFDVGVTIRMNGDSSVPRFFAYMGMVNAGVIIFRANERTRAYVDAWEAATLDHENDQKALNASLGLNTSGFWKQRNGRWIFDAEEGWTGALHQPEGSDVVFKFWPAAVYNWYRSYMPDHEIKILHCRGEKKNLDLLEHFQ